MYSLARPTTTGLECYQITVSSIRSPELKQHYEAATPYIANRCAEYDTIAESNRFEEAAGKDFEVDSSHGVNMATLYQQQFTQNQRPRNIRENLLLSARHGLCPYCGYGSVTQLDHYLPKESFSATSVHPSNLVPACADCNHAKRAYVPNSNSPALLHPYFDVTFDTRWLTAKLERSEISLPTIYFDVRLEEVNPALEERILAHFKQLNLWKRSASWSGQLLSNYANFLMSDYGRELTSDQVIYDLRAMATRTSRNHVNSWEHATHIAMSKSEWFIENRMEIAEKLR
ncbi:HNH endonuclease [Glutamicibacter sp.]|uniref:HNH endonuclease n=1 Tax=Glutamicibacter sp. TaxID=1931995 RepID=UPI003D6C4E00